LSFGNRVFNGSYQVEGRLRKMVQLTVHDHIEAFDGIFDVHQYSFKTGKLLCYVERLGKESLNPSGPTYDQFILLRKLFHTQNGNDILKFFVSLKDFLNVRSTVIMFIAQNVRRKNP